MSAAALGWVKIPACERMESIDVSLIVSGVIFAGALTGIALRRVVPEEHLGPDAKDVIRLATGIIGTMAALVLGMLVSSAKSSYDTRRNEVAELASSVLSLDKLLAQYGPEAQGCRDELRRLVLVDIDRIWPREASRRPELKPIENVTGLYNLLQLLTPKNAAQAAAKAEAISEAEGLRRANLRMLIEAAETSMSIPLIVVVTAWLAAMFVGLGVFAPPNATVILALVICALSVSGALFVTMEMYTPFSGVLRISPAPIRDALSQIGR